MMQYSTYSLPLHIVVLCSKWRVSGKVLIGTIIRCRHNNYVHPACFIILKRNPAFILSNYEILNGSKSFRPDQLFKVTQIKQVCCFSIQSPFISTHTDTDTLTSPQMALYIPSQHFPFGSAFVCQAGNFWTHPLSPMVLLQ